MMGRLLPSILSWLVVVITLALAPTIETYNTNVTTNVAGATNAAYMLGMTAVDDFGGFLMIMGLLVAGGFFGIAGIRNKNVTVQDMLEVIGAVIIVVISLAMFSGSVIGYIDSLITAGTGFAKTAYGILCIVIYVAIIGGAGAYVGVKAYRSGGRRGRRSSKAFI